MKNTAKKLAAAALIGGVALCGPMTLSRAEAWGWEDTKEVVETVWDCVIFIAEHMPPPIIVDGPIPPRIISKVMWKAVIDIMK